MTPEATRTAGTTGTTGTAAKRGRPPAFDRTAVLAAATRLFWERGYQATSVGELTGAMGIKPGSLYAAFGDKAALFREVVEGYGRSPEGGFVGVALAQEASARAAFARILREAARIYPDPTHPAGCLVMNAAVNTAAQDEEVAEFLRGLRAENLRLFEERLTDAERLGELPPGTSPAALARYFGTVLQGMSQRARDGADTTELAATAELALAAWPPERP
ncbi:TetR family transcriptional regulator [Kitasatospora phosalacinea]|uniref:TetR family transcriptional regulator n=1 Tax=Kitasatospora phosalacinea TaxID=2065 RepID=A0A9W6Q5V5_9ACTN|nr:TetR/AcrR family transcriptional regulator [Kitasatospora phosalacinea]GLW70480.1 TetR family transcriptional regulator [Kitasatospora phosalacinea]